MKTFYFYLSFRCPRKICACGFTRKIDIFPTLCIVTALSMVSRLESLRVSVCAYLCANYRVCALARERILVYIEANRRPKRRLTREVRRQTDERKGADNSYLMVIQHEITEHSRPFSERASSQVSLMVVISFDTAPRVFTALVLLRDSDV